MILPEAITMTTTVTVITSVPSPSCTVQGISSSMLFFSGVAIEQLMTTLLVV